MVVDSNTKIEREVNVLENMKVQNLDKEKIDFYNEGSIKVLNKTISFIPIGSNCMNFLNFSIVLEIAIKEVRNFRNYIINV